jgi:ABC-2 type transport system permease protein
VVEVRLLRANLRKLVRPATWVTFLLLVALLGLIYLALIASTQQTADAEAAIAARIFVTFPGAYVAIITMILSIGGLLAVAFGAAIAGSEWSWGTLKAAVARGESRSRYTLLGYLGVAIVVLVGMLAAFMLGVGMATVGALVLNVPLTGMTDSDALVDLGDLFARASLSLAMNTALGFAIATIARSQLAGIGVGIGVYFAEGIAGIFLPGVIKWFPFSAASAVVANDPTLGEGASAAARLDPNVALLVVVIWLVAALGVASLWTERAEIAG